MLNQLQLLLLLLLTKSEFPQDVIEVIAGSSFALFSFDFINLPSIKFIKSLNTNFDFVQNNSMLEKIGVDFGGTLANISSLLCTIFIIFISHICLKLVHIIVTKLRCEK